MSNVRVLVSDKLADAGLRVLREAPGVDLEFRPGMSEDELCNVIGEYDGLIIRSATQVTPRVVEEAHKLKVIGRAGIGVDNVDIPAASRRGIVVMNTPTGNSVTTAEHALTLLASLARKIPQAVASMRTGKWEKSKFQGREMAYKTLGIIGLGNIGRIVADRAQGLKMKVIGVDPVMSSDRAAELGIELVEFDELLKRADFVTIHAPLTPDTKNMFGDVTFEKMKSGALLVNAARGGIVDEEALARAITEGKIAGAALDVFGKEPIDPDHPLPTTCCARRTSELRPRRRRSAWRSKSPSKPSAISSKGSSQTRSTSPRFHKKSRSGSRRTSTSPERSAASLVSSIRSTSARSE